MREMELLPSRSLMKNQQLQMKKRGKARFWIPCLQNQVLNNVIRKLQIKNLMKRMLLSLVLAVVCTGLFAQSVDKAKELLKANKLPEAKYEIDKTLLVDKNQKNAEAWYYKVKIYNAIAANDQLKTQYPDALLQSLDALKNYVQYDDKKFTLLILDSYKPINEIYQGLFQTGANDYNAQKYAEALVNFKGAIAAIGFMYKEGWIKQSMDSTATLYAGISAEKADKRDEAVIYYKT